MTGRRYISADHAVAQWRKMRAQVEGCKAFDYERPQVQSAPSPENPHIDKLDDLWLLERVLCWVYLCVGQGTWAEWWRIKVMQSTGNDATSMERMVLRKVNGKIEEGLAREGRLIRNAVGVRE